MFQCTNISSCLTWNPATINFTPQNLQHVFLPHNDPLMVTLSSGVYQVQRILIDTESLTNILFYKCYQQTEQDYHKLEPSSTILVDFNGRATQTTRQLTLEVVTKAVWAEALFLVETSVFPYNAILGCPWIHSVAAITSTFHQKIKILTPNEVIKIKGE